MSRSVPRLLLATVVLPLVVIVGFQSAWAAYACRVDGRVRDHCCCTPAKRTHVERGPVDGTPRIAARNCCDVTVHAQTEPPVVRESGFTQFAHYLVAVPAHPLLAVTPRIESIVEPATQARPPPRVPLFLDKHAILR